MTLAELEAKLLEIRRRQEESTDIINREQDHINADNLLLEYIDSSAVEKAFRAIEKWYE